MDTEDDAPARLPLPPGPLNARTWLNLWASLGALAWGLPGAERGPGLAALQRCARACWADNPAAAAVLRAQRLAIEALCLSRNAGLREHLLPQLLSGERAAALGDVRCRGFFFREDEWLADAAITPQLRALDQLLRPPQGL